MTTLPGLRLAQPARQVTCRITPKRHRSRPVGAKPLRSDAPDPTLERRRIDIVGGVTRGGTACVLCFLLPSCACLFRSSRAASFARNVWPVPGLDAVAVCGSMGTAGRAVAFTPAIGDVQAWSSGSRSNSDEDGLKRSQHAQRQFVDAILQVLEERARRALVPRRCGARERRQFHRVQIISHTVIRDRETGFCDGGSCWHSASSEVVWTIAGRI